MISHGKFHFFFFFNFDSLRLYTINNSHELLQEMALHQPTLAADHLLMQQVPKVVTIIYMFAYTAAF